MLTAFAAYIPDVVLKRCQSEAHYQLTRDLLMAESPKGFFFPGRPFCIYMEFSKHHPT